MRFQVVGANSESGDDVDLTLEAADQSEVERIAHEKGILVAAIKPAPADEDAIALIDDDDDPPLIAPSASQVGVPHAAPAGHAASPAPANGDHAAPHAAAHPPEKHGMITLNANSPSESGHTSDGQVHEAHKTDTPMEYHILMNQALYLLETAVNKYLKDGWEPQGGLTVGTSNNAMQYFQALSRRKKV